MTSKGTLNNPSPLPVSSVSTQSSAAPTVRVIKPVELSPADIIPVVTTKVRPALKPLSITTEPWTTFGNFDTRIFKDDFCHEKHFTAKVKATSVDGATVNIK